MNFMYVRCVIGQSQFIAAGGSGANETKVFDHSRNNAVVGTVTGLPRGVFAIDFAPDCPKIAIAGGDASIRILDIADKEWISTNIWEKYSSIFSFPNNNQNIIKKKFADVTTYIGLFNVL